MKRSFQDKLYKRLKYGDEIAVVSPAGIVEKKEIDKSASIFKKNGLLIKYLPSVFKRDEYLAGSDDERYKDLRDALLNKEYKAILFSRGGYGSMRILERLNKTDFIYPKPLFGFSDITALHIFFNRLGWITFHSPNLNGFAELTENARRFFFDIIFGKVDFREVEYGAKDTLYSGIVDGTLLGGNLSVISALSGTKYDIDLRDKILFIEDVNEEPYKIDRMLTQLSLRSDIRYLKGVVFGRFSNCAKESLLSRIFMGFARSIKKPTIYGIEIGHIKNNLIIPFNVRCLINAKKGFLNILERIFI